MSEKQQLPQDEVLQNPLVLKLASVLASVIKTLVGYIVGAFPDWDEGVARLSQLMEEKGVENPSIGLMFDVIEERPEVGISAVNEAFMKLPLVIRLSVNGAVGITQGVLRINPEWAGELAVQKEKLILQCLRSPGDPIYLMLADVLEAHPRTLKMVTMWIWNKIGIQYIETIPEMPTVPAIPEPEKQQ